MNERLEQSTETNDYAGYRASWIEKSLGKPELEALRNWYIEQREKLPEMKVTEVPVTGGQWKYDLAEITTKDQEGNDVTRTELEKVTGAHFTVEGRHAQVLNPDGTVKFQWNQPAVCNASSEVTLNLPEGKQTVRSSGFVGVLMDEENRVLLNVAQEILADTPKRALVRTPFQTSATKLEQLLAGKDEVDPTLADLLKKLGGGKGIDEMFASGDIDFFPLALADANRISADNYGFAVRLADPTLKESLTAGGRNRWCNDQEIAGLKRSGLLNSHTASAIDAAKAK